jgi:hypothetical protein
VSSYLFCFVLCFLQFMVIFQCHYRYIILGFVLEALFWISCRPRVDVVVKKEDMNCDSSSQVI